MLKLEDFSTHSDKLTEKNFRDEIVFTFNHNVLANENFTKYI